MILTDSFHRLKNYFTPHSRRNRDNSLTKTAFGHTKTFDAEGYIVSDIAKPSEDTTLVTHFYPGTKHSDLHKKVLYKQQLVQDQVTDEMWYDIHGKKQAYWSSSQPELIMLLDKKERPEYLTQYSQFESQTEPLLKQVKNRTPNIGMYDLSEISQLIDDQFDLLRQKLAKHATKQEESAQPKSEPVVEIQEQENPVVTATQQKEEPENTPTVETPKQVQKQKLTPEMRQKRWKDQLSKRIKQHNVLVLQKEKMENNDRMDSKKKAERLASLDKRLTHNERAQHLLKTRLAAIKAARKRDNLKQVKHDRKQQLQELQTKLKQRREQFRLTKSVLTNEEKDSCRQDFEQLTTQKKRLLAKYRASVKSTKLASITACQLKSTKRQRTIFDLAIISRKKDALEHAMNKEINLFNMGLLSDRLDELRAQRRALLDNFKESTRSRRENSPRVLDMKLQRRPLLSISQQTSEK